MTGILGSDIDSPLSETRIPKETGWRPSQRHARVAVALGLMIVIGLGLLARAVATPPKERIPGP